MYRLVPYGVYTYYSAREILSLYALRYVKQSLDAQVINLLVREMSEIRERGISAFSKVQYFLQFPQGECWASSANNRVTIRAERNQISFRIDFSGLAL